MAMVRLFTHALYSNVREGQVAITKGKRSHSEGLDIFLWMICVCVCGGRTNLPVCQQGLNTHRVNIPGFNPGWVDIGPVWVQDFIFLPLTLVFADSDLNSIGVICLSKARTGTRRSWVCVHCKQGNSIRLWPHCVCGWDSSVDIEGLELVDSTSGGAYHFKGKKKTEKKTFIVIESRRHRWTLLRTHCLHILATSQKQTVRVPFPLLDLRWTRWYHCHQQHHKCPKLFVREPTMFFSADQFSFYSGGDKKKIKAPHQSVTNNFKTIQTIKKSTKALVHTSLWSIALCKY